MFDFFKKLFGGGSCNDCEGGENDTNTVDTPTFPISEVAPDTTITDKVPDIIAQPSLKMNMPTATNPTIDTPSVELPIVEQPIASIVDIPAIEEVVNTEPTIDTLSNSEVSTTEPTIDTSPNSEVSTTEPTIETSSDSEIPTV